MPIAFDSIVKISYIWEMLCRKRKRLRTSGDLFREWVKEEDVVKTYDF